MSELAVIASLIEQFATEIRHLQKTEVREVEEGFGKGQKVLLQCLIRKILFYVKISAD